VPAHGAAIVVGTARGPPAQERNEPGADAVLVVGPLVAPEADGVGVGGVGVDGVAAGDGVPVEGVVTVGVDDGVAVGDVGVDDAVADEAAVLPAGVVGALVADVGGALGLAVGETVFAALVSRTQRTASGFAAALTAPVGMIPVRYRGSDTPLTNAAAAAGEEFQRQSVSVASLPTWCTLGT
jgi:hypothetical protein